jgi:alkyl sulfatase BDS1-like metallo-beta-lactamase superfamily hydrolase
MHKPATDVTRKVNGEFLKLLPFENTQDFEDIRRGIIEETPDVVIRDKSGKVVWDMQSYYGFLGGEAVAPDTVNPSLWRHERLTTVAGLFEVVDGIWQVRGYDISNMTLIRSNSGYIIVDPLTSVETAQAALALAFKHLEKRPIVAVIVTHSHADHYGGLEAVVSAADVKSGAVRLIAPDKFAEETVSESIFVGKAMARRACYQFGTLLDRGPQDQVGSGLGKDTSTGRVSLLFPNTSIRQTGETLNVDGVDIVFQMTPDAEAPAEMCFYLPQFKALCMAELVNSHLHNLLPFRGAKVRSAKRWAHHLQEALELFGGKTDVLFITHHWPCWGRDDVATYLRKQRDLYKFINDQTVRRINHGQTMIEIAEELKLPESLDKEWFNRGYYGHLNHNVKATYQWYLGWFDANPAHLHELPPVEASRNYVEYMGGPEEVLRKAKASFAKGEYRWVAQVVNHLVFAYPENNAARELQADALEQMGYQSEGGTWRNCYLTGAQELRGLKRQASLGSINAAAVANLPTELLLDYLAVQLDPLKAEGAALRINLHFTDSQEEWQWTLRDSVMNCWNSSVKDADAEYTLSRDAFNAIACRGMTVDEAIFSGAVVESGQAGALKRMFAALEQAGEWFNIVLP